MTIDRIRIKKGSLLIRIDLKSNACIITRQRAGGSCSHNEHIGGVQQAVGSVQLVAISNLKSKRDSPLSAAHFL
jgi:hypothetical protein